MPVAFLAMFARQIRANTGQYQNIPPISRRCQFRWSMLWAVVEIVWNIESRLLPRGSKFYVYCLWLCKSPCAFFPFGLKVLILKYLALKYKEPTCFKICMVQCDGMSYALLSLDFSWEMNDRVLLMLCWWWDKNLHSWFIWKACYQSTHESAFPSYFCLDFVSFRLAPFCENIFLNFCVTELAFLVIILPSL